jgi:tetratricopeptide (TPR) repeat protein
MALYQKVIAEEPTYASAFEGLASSRLDAFRQSGDRGSLALAKQAARAAADVDPLIWKPLFALASMEWFDGNLAGAIAASEEALQRDENEYVLGNLGTFYVCSGAFEQARTAYLRAQELAPRSYVGDEMLGSVYYFLGDYDQAIRLRRRAIESIGDGNPEIHEMWANLGDAYRHNGDTEGAVDAYVKAVEIAERDYLRGTAPVADRAARAYYYTALRTLQPDRVPTAIDRDIAAQLDDIADGLTEATAHRRMAQIWLLRGRRDKAREAMERAVATCPGYAALPDLAALQAEDGS